MSPVGLAIIGGAEAVICARLKRQRVAKWLGWAAFVWLWLWMTPIMTWIVGVPLEREFLVDGRVPMVESFPEADVIVLLGGSMGIETNTSSYAEMATSADRVWQEYWNEYDQYSGTYLICWDDRIVRLEFNEPLTNAQIATAAAKLAP